MADILQFPDGWKIFQAFFIDDGHDRGWSMTILNKKRLRRGWRASRSAVPPATLTASRRPTPPSTTYGPPRLQVFSAIPSEQSASTYPASGLCPGQDGDPRAPVLIKLPASSAIFLGRQN